MKITFDNIGGIKLIPYGQNTAKIYGLGDTHSVTPSGRGRLNGKKLLLPNTREATGLVLDISGRVWLDGVKVWNPSTKSYDDGGWLGEVTTTLNITYDNYDSLDPVHLEETCSITSLGVIPAQATGPAIKVENLSFQTLPMFNTNHGTVLHPNASAPYGDRVGQTWGQPGIVFCAYCNADNSFDGWKARHYVDNYEWEKYGNGAADNFTVNHDGEYVPSVIADCAVCGVIHTDHNGGFSFDLSETAGKFQ